MVIEKVRDWANFKPIFYSSPKKQKPVPEKSYNFVGVIELDSDPLIVLAFLV